MAEYLPVRSIARSQKIRVGDQQLSPDVTKYVDITDGKVKRDLQRHQAIGGLVVVGPVSGSNRGSRVVTGGVVTVGSGTRTVDVTAGEFRRAVGTYATVAAADEAAGTANATGAVRVDTVVWTDAAAVAIRIPGAVLDTDVPLATVSLANGGAAYTAPTDIRPRV